MELTAKDVERFNSYVFVKPGCWPWQRARWKNGYGSYKLQSGEIYGAHRIAYFIATGVDPANLLVCHSCDNPRCCNPAHLFLGTVQDNIADKVIKNRQPSGAKHVNSKLSNEEIRRIRFLHSLGLSGTELGRKFGVGQQQISRLIRGERRKDA